MYVVCIDDITPGIKCHHDLIVVHFNHLNGRLLVCVLHLFLEFLIYMSDCVCHIAAAVNAPGGLCIYMMWGAFVCAAGRLGFLSAVDSPCIARSVPAAVVRQC